MLCNITRKQFNEKNTTKTFNITLQLGVQVPYDIEASSRGEAGEKLQNVVNRLMDDDRFHQLQEVLGAVVSEFAEKGDFEISDTPAIYASLTSDDSDDCCGCGHGQHTHDSGHCGCCDDCDDDDDCNCGHGCCCCG